MSLANPVDGQTSSEVSTRSKLPQKQNVKLCEMRRLRKKTASHLGEIHHLYVKAAVAFFACVRTLLVRMHSIEMLSLLCCSEQGELCNGTGQYFGTEQATNVQQCMFRCAWDTHPFLGSACWGFEYSTLSGVCFYYGYSEVKRCDVGGTGPYVTYRLIASRC